MAQRFDSPLTPRQKALGVGYLAFQLLGLPQLLHAIRNALPVAMSDAALNLAFCTVNFIAILLLFPSFFRRELAVGKAAPAMVFRSAALGLLLYACDALLVRLLLCVIAPDFANVNDASIAAEASYAFLCTAFSTVVLTPLAEEFLYRALVFGGLHARGRVLAYLISALLFSTIHVAGYLGSYPPGTLALCFLQYLPAGLALAWSYERSGCLLSPVLIHTFINAVGIFSLR